jgi:hypothetical protein
VCLRSLGDDTLPEAVQAAATPAREAATASVPAMWTGAAMSGGLGVLARLASIEAVGRRPGIEADGHNPERLIRAFTLRTVS